MSRPIWVDFTFQMSTKMKTVFVLESHIGGHQWKKDTCTQADPIGVLHLDTVALWYALHSHVMHVTDNYSQKSKNEEDEQMNIAGNVWL